ncbi:MULTISPECIES: TPM domain-containing protein [Prochlorococcus]|uniref:TPM domain-containing protein n=1 Tax=Prochlorococcus TaxID=1218 RepID=UPI0005338938|nr:MULTISPECIES: TPM domain-containing protein [Prochlorococcus]KGG12548.1 hypothetical protein EV05_1760 [Prochlorococcus sp. MIT 0601]
MKIFSKLVVISSIFYFIFSLILTDPVFAYNNPDLLPDHETPVIDLAKSFNKNQVADLEESLINYESNTGWKIKVLTQYENTPGSAIKDFWGLDERTLLVVADPRGGNLLNFNVGEAYFALMPRLFWVELQTRFGNQFYVRDYGEGGAIIDAIKSVELCLDRGGCQVVPGLPKEQWLWTLSTSILGGIIAGIASSPRKENEFIAWRWLLLISPLWIILFGVFGITPVITRTNDILPLLRNVMAFLGSSIAGYWFARNTLAKDFNT